MLTPILVETFENRAFMLHNLHSVLILDDKGVAISAELDHTYSKFVVTRLQWGYCVPYICTSFPL